MPRNSVCEDRDKLYAALRSQDRDWCMMRTQEMVVGAPSLSLLFLCVPSCLTVRKQEIIKVTEQLIEAISNGDFESYT